MNKTAAKSLKKIRKYLEADKLGAYDRLQGGCVYQQKDTFCGVGCLFNPAQLKDIKRRGLNDKDVGHLAEIIGEHNLFKVTGFELPDLQMLQDSHDEIMSDDDLNLQEKKRLFKLFLDQFEKELKTS